MNILLTADGDPLEEGAGAHRVLNEHAQRLAARGHRVSILFRKIDQDAPSPAAWKGCRLYPYGADMSSMPRVLRSTLRNARVALDRICEDGAPDVACLHQPFTGMAFIRRPSFPLVYDFHSPAPAEYLSRLALRPEATSDLFGKLVHRTLIPHMIRLLEGMVLKRCSKIFCESASMRQELQRWHPRAVRSEARIIPGGVDIDRFRPLDDRRRGRERLGLPVDQRIIFVLRLLVPRVGMENFLEALAQLRKLRSDFVCVIGGKGPLRDPLEKQAARLGLADHVRFLGFVPEEDLADVYGCADLFVQPDTELQGFGLPIPEALACGTPVLATPVGGANEILAALHGGKSLFSGLDAETMGREMNVALDWSSDAELRAEFRRYAEERYSWERIVDQLEECLTEAREDFRG
ncbi:MAG: glycosyltransferase family 4 protein [Acidobacteria bacterium]|nr:glycosyltransferase family 4 protein [Acidobacteriota bacterium]